MNTSGALKQYQQMKTHSGVADATPHKLISMLFEGVVDNLTAAKAYMQDNNPEMRSKKLNSAITIIGGLQASLDFDKGGDIANNLDSLYEYMSVKLFEANKSNAVVHVDEILTLISEIREAWNAIPGEPKPE